VREPLQLAVVAGNGFDTVAPRRLSLDKCLVQRSAAANQLMEIKSATR
jgi:hypothetical protein